MEESFKNVKKKLNVILFLIPVKTDFSAHSRKKQLRFRGYLYIILIVKRQKFTKLIHRPTK